jgi:hypothetical protein
LPKAPAPHGTEAAYKRHLRHKEEPCDACRAAHRELQKAKRAKASPLSVVGRDYGSVPVGSRLDALKRQRDLLNGAIATAAASDVKSVAAISRELRAIWAEIDELSRGSENTGGDLLDNLTGGLAVVPCVS